MRKIRKPAPDRNNKKPNKTSRPDKGRASYRSSAFTYRPRQPSAYERIIWDCESYERDICAEVLAVGNGLKTVSDTAAVAAKYAALFSPKNVKYTRHLADCLFGRAVIERHDRSAWHLLEGLIARKLAKASDELDTAQSRGQVHCAGRNVPYHDVIPRLSAERDPERRERLWNAYLGFIEDKLNPLAVEYNKLRLRTMNRQGFVNERDYAEKRKRFSLADLAAKLAPVRAATEELYMEAMRDHVRKRLRLRFPGMSRAHESYFLGMREFDRLFPAKRLLPICLETFRGLGLDFAAQANLRVDAENRPGKDSRAFCVGINPPEEVHLSIKPRGGVEDYASFLHEAGHAWHYALTGDQLCYEYRAMPRSYALTEVFSFLFEYLTQNERWLVSVAGLDPEQAADVADRLKLADLYLLRRFLGKLEYEIEFSKQPLDNWHNAFAYRQILSSYTGTAYDDVSYLLDMDEDLYTADYLRAWLAEAQLREKLVRDFGPDWFRCPAAGEFLKGLWAKGESWENEDLVRHIGAEPWDTSALLRRFIGSTA